MEYNFGEKVERLLNENGKTKKSLYDHLKMTANGFDGMLKNNSISAVRLAQIADFFGMPILYFYGTDSAQSDIVEDFGDQVTRRMAQNIEEIKHLFEEELRVKNQQIAGLQRTVDALVGKFEGDTDQPTSNYEAAQENAKRAYLQLGLALVDAPRQLAPKRPIVASK
ncbi:hypothetical protein [Spirosoma oryzicola]|uniref:hypothetical protein n=1 Tax=Spirosoma oryzicola TaxID=2898794 RepID=UPI001E4306D3|nr:hypothetical protein [Spirosoma oryzicola]UHG93463.1 hypothetical protein LQ777_11275 [Spirosoma oryzicola]